jgi:hypothetical protein
MYMGCNSSSINEMMYNSPAYSRKNTMYLLWTLLILILIILMSSLFNYLPFYRMYWTVSNLQGAVQIQNGALLGLQWGILNHSQLNMLQLEMKIVGKHSIVVN